jgi:formate dehydrogenase iron-sulfur subunit
MKAILCDVNLCTACEKCVQACTESNDLPAELPATRAHPDRLSSRRFVSLVEVAPDIFARKACLHCLKPACVDACLVGALHKTPDGPVVYDADKCIGCRYCMLACPFGIPRYEWDQTSPFMAKCTMCWERLQGGRAPACVEACPYGALSFGDRDALLATAHRRIKAAPDTYVPKVYGENDVGGTCLLYVSQVPLAKLGWPHTVGDDPLSSLTWPVMSKTPALALTVAAGLSALTWIIQRRNRLASECACGKPAVDEPEKAEEE